MCAKMKELGPMGGYAPGTPPPPRSANVYSPIPLGVCMYRQLFMYTSQYLTFLEIQQLKQIKQTN